MVFLFLCCLLSACAITKIQEQDSLTVIYVAPSRLPSGNETLESPLDVQSAINRIAPGGWIYMRCGTYHFNKTLAISKKRLGLPERRTHMMKYYSEQPIFNFSKQIIAPKNKGISLEADYWQIERLTIEHAGDNCIFVSGSHNLIASSITRYNADTGLQIGRARSKQDFDEWPSHNQIISCESYDNKDSDGEHADGFAAKLTVGLGNIFRMCTAHHNIDDGWDLYTKKIRA